MTQALQSDARVPATPSGATGPQRAVVAPAGAVWIPATAVLARYGGRSHMWLVRRLQNDPGFPRFARFGRLRFWRVAELDSYDRACATRS
jgi:hypothetical protein